MRGFIAATLGMIFGMRGNAAGVSVEWSGADVAEHDEHSDGNEEKRGSPARHRDSSVVAACGAVKPP